jgi:GxxExxY protein
MEPDRNAPLLLQDITGIAIKGFYAAYNELAGFPENVVRRGLALALRDERLSVQEEVHLPVWFRGQCLVTFKADLLVESCLLIEVKAKPEIDAFDKAQLLHYLKATNLDVGLLMNFGRRPEFKRLIFETARARERVELPTDLEQFLAENTTRLDQPDPRRV